MTVNELIKKLQEFDGNLTVCVETMDVQEGVEILANIENLAINNNELIIFGIPYA